MKNMISEIIEKHKYQYGLLINFGSVVIEVKTENKAIENGLFDYFREFTTCERMPDITIYANEDSDFSLDLDFVNKDPEPGKSKIKEAYYQQNDLRIVKKLLTGMYFLFDKKFNLAIGPCLENLNQLVNFINNRFIETLLNNDNLLFHASAVTKNNVGYALCGFAGAGKSTLALHLMNKGWDFVSNDRLLVKSSGNSLIMNGVIKYPRINPGTILNNPSLKTILDPQSLIKFESMLEHELWTLEQKYDGFIDKIYGENRFILTNEMTRLIILNWKRNSDELKIEKIDLSQRADLLPAFTKEPGLFYNPSSKDKEFLDSDYIKLLENCDVYEVSGGLDFKKLTEILDNQL